MILQLHDCLIYEEFTILGICLHFFSVVLQTILSKGIKKALHISLAHLLLTLNVVQRWCSGKSFCIQQGSRARILDPCFNTFTTSFYPAVKSKYDWINAKPTKIFNQPNYMYQPVFLLMCISNHSQNKLAWNCKLRKKYIYSLTSIR